MNEKSTLESILKAFTVGFLLRSFFAGVFFVISFLFAKEGSYFASAAFSKEWLWGALVSGVIAYSLHRSVIYPILEWALNSKPAKRSRRNGFTLISMSTIEFLTKRWDTESKTLEGLQVQANTESERLSYRTQQLKNWGDLIHLQFVSASCLILGAWLGSIFSTSDFRSDWGFCWLPAVVMFLAAIISNWRSYALEESWEDEKQTPPAKTCEKECSETCSTPYCFCMMVFCSILGLFGIWWLLAFLYEMMLASIKLRY